MVLSEKSTKVSRFIRTKINNFVAVNLGQNGKSGEDVAVKLEPAKTKFP